MTGKRKTIKKIVSDREINRWMQIMELYTEMNLIIYSLRFLILIKSEKGYFLVKDQI